jgi:hypothetical protein
MKKEMLVILLMLLNALIVITPIIEVRADEPENLLLVERGLNYNKYINQQLKRYEVEIAVTPINYYEDEQWTPIQPDFYVLDTEHPAYQYGYRAGNDRGLYNIYFKPNAQDDWTVAFAYNKSDDPTTHVLRTKLMGMAYLDPSQNNQYEIIQETLDSTGYLEENRGVYPEAFTGTDVVWTYESNKLKEEIVMSNDTRTVLETYPPNHFGLSNEFSYLVFITELDYEGLEVYSDGQQQMGNFTVIGDIQFRDVLNDIKFALPMGYAYEQNDPHNKHEVTYRIIQFNGNYYLLSGISIETLDSMTFPVVIDPSVEITPEGAYGIRNYGGEGYGEVRNASTGEYFTTTYFGQTQGLLSVGREFLVFNTTALPSDIEIISTNLTQYCSGGNNECGENWQWSVYHDSSDTYPTITNNLSMFNHSYYDEGSGGHILADDLIASNWGNITFNAVGNTFVAPQGYTRLCLRSSRDYNYTAPTGSEYMEITPSYSVLHVTYTNGTGSVLTNETTNIGETSAQLNGFLTDSLDGTYSVGFWIGTSPVSEDSFDRNISAGTAIGNETFDAMDTNLSEGTFYYVRAWGFTGTALKFGNQTSFNTLPASPTSLTATENYPNIDLTWTKGAGANTTIIVRKEGSVPTSTTDGTIIYNGTGSSYSDTTATKGTINYYNSWSHTYDNLSTGNSSASAMLPSEEPESAGTLEITGDTNDAYAHLDHTNTDYLTGWNTSIADNLYNTTDLYVGQLNSTGSGGAFVWYRTYLYFDTSSIGNNVIDSAYLQLTKKQNLTQHAEWRVVMQNSSNNTYPHYHVCLGFGPF